MCYTSSAAEQTLSNINSRLKVTVFNIVTSFCHTGAVLGVVLRIFSIKMQHGCVFECFEFTALMLQRGS